MKNYYSIILILFLSILVTSCSKTTTDNSLLHNPFEEGEIEKVKYAIEEINNKTNIKR